MSLIKCPECGHEISSYADKYIYFGCTMTMIKKTINKKTEMKKETTSSKTVYISYVSAALGIE